MGEAPGGWRGAVGGAMGGAAAGAGRGEGAAGGGPGWLHKLPEWCGASGVRREGGREAGRGGKAGLLWGAF